MELAQRPGFNINRKYKNLFLTKVMSVFSFPRCHISIHLFPIMSARDGRKFSEDELKTRLNELIDLNDYLDGCVSCGLLRLLHKGQSFTRSRQGDSQEVVNIWKDYQEKI